MIFLVIFIGLILLILLISIIILLTKNKHSKMDEFKIINTHPVSTVPVRQNPTPSSVQLHQPSDFGYGHRYPGFGYGHRYPGFGYGHRYPRYYYKYPYYNEYIYENDYGNCCDDWSIDGRCEWESTTHSLKKGTIQQCIKYKDCTGRKNGLNDKEKDIKCSKFAME